MKSVQGNQPSAASAPDIEQVRARVMPLHEALINPAGRTRAAPGTMTANRRQIIRLPPRPAAIHGRSGENESFETGARVRLSNQLQSAAKNKWRPSFRSFPHAIGLIAESGEAPMR